MVNTRTNQTHTQYKRVVGVFKRREDLESALQALQDHGIDKERISLLARHVEDVRGAEGLTDGQGNEAAEGAGIGATTGTVLGGVGGFLVGAGVLAIPGVGPVLAAGVGISEIAATLAGAGIGAAAGGLVGALVGAGIPEDRAKVYEKRIKAGDYLLMVDGTTDSLRQVEAILRDRNIEELGTYDAPDLARQYQSTTSTTTTTTEHPPTSSHNATVSTRDIDNDGEPEVFIVDERGTAQRNRVR
jgi:hypothetical protein